MSATELKRHAQTIVRLRELLERAVEEDRAARAKAEQRARVLEEVAAARRALDEANAKLKQLGAAASTRRAASGGSGEWVDNGDGTWTSPKGRRYTAEVKARMADSAARMRHIKAAE